MGMVLTGVAETGYTLGTPLLVTGLANLASQHITQTNNPFAYRQIKEFYDQAANGAQLYVMLVANTMTVASMADKTNNNGAVKLLQYAAGAIKVLGLMSDDTTVTVSATTSGLNDDVATAITNAQSLANTYAGTQQPLRVAIGGTSYQGTAATLTNYASTGVTNRVAVVVGDTQPSSEHSAGKGAALGLLLGTLATVPVMRKVSRVRSGALTNTAAYLKTTAITDPSISSAPATIAGKGFITLQNYPNRSGYYWSGDPTLVVTTDDYAMLGRGRVIDKAQILAYNTFLDEVDDEVPVNSDGTMDAGFCKWLAQQIVNQINNTMTANREISNVVCFIDPAQNVLSTNKVNVVLKITPVGYATDIEISLGFDNPAA
jgi:hypothetical protein